MQDPERERTKKVLVIDDDVMLARLIEHNLSQIKAEVLKAYDGYEGISLVRTRQPDLVILDIVLPDIDGWEVLQRIRQISKVPIVMLTIKENEEEFGPCKYNSGLSFVELDPDHLFMIKKFVRANSHKKIKE